MTTTITPPDVMAVVVARDLREMADIYTRFEQHAMTDHEAKYYKTRIVVLRAAADLLDPEK